MKKYDLAVVIGRFQPVHNAHIALLARAGELAEKVLVIIGSDRRPRSYKNPWTGSERAAMLISALVALGDQTGAKYVYEKNTDTIYNDQAWVSRIQQLVGRHSDATDRIVIVGHEKDSSSFYLRMFPQWRFESQPLMEPLDATQIRDIYFSDRANMNFLQGVVPASTLEFLALFQQTPAYRELIEEKNFLIQYKRQFAQLPYPPIFVTADAVVVQSGHVLMVRRGAQPGRGQLALPGGFVNAQSDASVSDAAIRELREETGIRVPERVLRGSVAGNRVFDAPDRSQRGRTITHAFYFLLSETAGALPKVKGADDAERAIWVPIGSLDPAEIFEDHFDIIQHFTGA